MELIWSLAILSILFSALIHLFLFTKKKRRLPPGPPAIPVLGSFLCLGRSISQIESILIQTLFKKYGPIVTLYIGSTPYIFIADRSVAYKALVEHGAVFSNRPTPPPALRFYTCNQHDITSAHYGPLWRLLRRNLTSEILHPSRIKLFADGRDWVLRMLIDQLHAQSESSSDRSITAKESFLSAMFRLLVLMCFGEKLDEKALTEIEAATRATLLYSSYLDVFHIFPAISTYIFFNRRRTAKGLMKKQRELYLPLIKARREHIQRKGHDASTEERFMFSYVDSLLDMKLPDKGGRNLTEEELAGLCSEFLDAGTDTTSTALEWIMAELVNHPEIQKKLIDEIESVVDTGNCTVKEEELQRMPYLKAVIMEGLRRHPPGHFVLPHAVMQEIEFEGYVIPKDATINFMVADMGRNDKVWEDAMEFRPERFLDGDGQGVDITGSREIKMMPFGVGRRICPGLGLATLHLEYFVANLLREFEWKAVEGDEVDLSEKLEFTFVMKHPLRARLIPRAGNPSDSIASSSDQNACVS